MNQVKRKSSSTEEKTKKLRNEIEQSITSIENLSNEFFYEIFDYLDGFEIYYSFSNLNYRFQQLINSSSLLLKINIDSIDSEEKFMDNHEKIILNKKQIFSIHSLMHDTNKIISSFNINSSFNRLESLIFESIEPEIFNLLLPKLACLPNFSSLKIEAYNTLEELNNTYRLIFALPKLRYINFSAEEYQGTKITVSLPPAIKTQFSSIEYLIIKHTCRFNELSLILSYTPQLRRLKFYHMSNNDSSLKILSPITLSNLTHVSMYTHFVTFDEFEMFISKMNSKLSVLSVESLSDDITYLDLDRWEELILRYLPQLEKFYLKYNVNFEDDDETPMFYKEPYQFVSSFWTERQWIFDAEVDFYSVIYSIRPYKERWYEYGQHKMINSSDELSKSMRLYLPVDPLEANIDTLNIGISHIVTVAEVYHLEIIGTISIGTLNEMLLSFSKIESLLIYSLSLSQPNGLSIREENVLSFISQKNEITKVNIKQIIDIEEVYCLMKICPRMTYLKVNHIINIDIESFVRLISMKLKTKCNHHLQLLCFRDPMADDKMVQQLEKTINSEKLFFDYTIKLVLDNIYLEWK